MASNSGESVMDVLARMKMELSFEVEESGQSGEASVPAGAVATATTPVQAPVATPPTMKSQPSPTATASAVLTSAGNVEAADPVDELNDYMGALLNRYGKGGDAAVTEPTCGPDAGEPTKSALPQRKPREVVNKLSLFDTKDGSEEHNAAESQVSPETGAEATELPAELCLLEQQEFKPRKRAPEEKACIDAMRELAVHSARRALQTFDNKRRGLDARHRLGLAFAAYLTSGVAFAFSDQTFSFLGLMAICGMATGSMFVINWQQTVALLKKSSGNG